MGRVRTKTVKRAAKVLLEKHYLKLTNDFHINKKILSEVAKVPTKSLRNKIAGFATHLMKRIQRGPVKGISLKVQQEERERRLDWVPKESEININKVTVDNETSDMIKRRFGEEFHAKINQNLQVKAAEVKKNARDNKRKPRADGEKRERKPREDKQKKEQKKDEKPQGETKTQQQPAGQSTQEEKAAPAKREGRRRGAREGQQ